MRYDESRGYTEKELAQLSGYPCSLVGLSLKSLMECGFVSREEDGTLVMNEFQGMVGSEAESTSRSRKSRCNATKMQQKCNTEKEIEKEIEIEIEKEVDVVVEGDNNDPTRQKAMGGKLGKGVVFLTQEQDEKLLELMDLEVYDKYVEKLADFIISKDAKVANHYQTILKWYREDCS